MRPYVIVADSCMDLPPQVVEKLELRVIPLSVEIEDHSYFHYPDERELSVRDFYRMMRDKKVGKTSLISVGAFEVLFTDLVKEGLDILYIAFSSGLSGTYQSAMIAKDMVISQHPEARIEIVDSLGASMGLGLLVHTAGQQRLAGRTLDDVVAHAEATKLTINHFFTVDDLGTLKRGGRLSDVQAFLGTLLQVKPVLHVNNQGKLVPFVKAKGRRHSLQTIIDVMANYIIDPQSQTIFISHGDVTEDADFVAQKIKEKYQVADVLIHPIGPIIGAHSGPGTIAVFFYGRQR